MVNDHDGATPVQSDLARTRPPFGRTTVATDDAGTQLPQQGTRLSHDTAAATAAVADAVAVASEEAAVEAAEAVVVTAAAVTQAAGRAADAAVSAKEARTVATDTALLADEEDARTAELEADLAGLYPGAGAPDALAPDWVVAQEILVAAEERDALADLRDETADERERAASLRSFLKDTPYAEDEQHAEGLQARRAAALDRLASKDDRVAAASARARLSAHLFPNAQPVTARSGARLTDVAAEISHDLRVPLSANMASMELLEETLKDHPDPTVAHLLSHAIRAGDRMARMLDHHMSSPTAGDPAPTPEVDLAEIVRQLVLDSADLLQPVGAVVEIGELPVVRAYPDEMYSVLQNLITNSIKFARPGVPAHVRVSARRSANGWRISVRDNGVGFPDNSDVDVFSLFSRGSSDVPGHGIGLATVARIITTHGGRVGITPTDTGAEIWFELPEDTAGR